MFLLTEFLTKMYTRFFAFGCSHTNYHWPSWADAIAHELKIPYYNYGRAGLGNVGIMHEMVAADIEHTFTDTDLIVVLWTSWSREDRHFEHGWMSEGNVFNSRFYSGKFVKKYWHYTNDIIKNSTAIISANKMFGDKIAYQAHILAPAVLEWCVDDTIKLTPKERELLNFYSAKFPEENLLDEYKVYSFDGHPSVAAHVKFVTDYIGPAIGLTLSPAILQEYAQIERQMQKVSTYKRMPVYPIQSYTMKDNS
jgi:hypothetical protein